MVTDAAFFSSLFVSVLFPVVVKLGEEAESIFDKDTLCEYMNQLQDWTQCTQGALWRAGIPVSPTGMPGQCDFAASPVEDNYHTLSDGELSIEGKK